MMISSGSPYEKAYVFRQVRRKENMAYLRFSVAICLLGFGTASGQLVTGGLEAYLDFTAPPSDTTITDQTGNGNNAILVTGPDPDGGGPVTGVPTWNGTGVRFFGGWIDVDPTGSLNTLGSGTLEVIIDNMHIVDTLISTGASVSVANTGNTGRDNDFELWLDHRALVDRSAHFSGRVGGVGQFDTSYLNGMGPADGGQREQYFVQWDGGANQARMVGRHQKGGVLTVSSTPWVATSGMPDFLSAAINLRLGARNDGNARMEHAHYQSVVNILRVYDRVLTDAEMAQNWDAYNEPFSTGIPTTTTWAYSHPQVVANYSQPFVPWPVSIHVGSISVNQPTMVKDANDVLYANGVSIPSWHIGQVARSDDGGQSWTRTPGLIDTRFTGPPAGFTALARSINGVGITQNGTLLAYFTVQYNKGGPYVGLSDPNFHTDFYVVRSPDEGTTWSSPIKLNTAPNENGGGNQTRFAQLPNGVTALVMPAWYQSDNGEPLPVSEQYDKTYIWTSSDDGVSWQRGAEPICLYGVEPDLKVLDSGRMLATVRYQRIKLPSDPPYLVSPYTGSTDLGDMIFRGTAILWSDDSGATWTEPRLLTALDEQTGCLVELADGTVLMVFGHKNDYGQRFMVSYDEGETWSKTIYDLHTGGMYASSAVLADGTVVTTIDNRPDGGLILTSLRWTPPSFEEVAAGGFWTPNVVEPLGLLTLSNCQEAIAAGYGIASDLDGDCYITLADLALQVGDWLLCIHPGDPDCERPWE
jgi:hypothetical protein